MNNKKPVARLYTTRQYPCGCRAEGTGDVPAYCAEHGAPLASGYVDIVFDGPPGHESGRFVETEDAFGKSVSYGEWIHRADRLWALRAPRAEMLNRDGWMESAAEFCRGMEYYRGLVDQIGKLLGDSAYIADDGSRSEDILRAKVPELVAARLKQAAKTSVPARPSSNQYCNQYMDDAPGVRADCASHLEKGRTCMNCPHRNIDAEVRDLRARFAHETTTEPLIDWRASHAVALEHRNKLARYILQSCNYNRLRDHACPQCMPEGGDLVKIDFVCAYHLAESFEGIHAKGSLANRVHAAGYAPGGYSIKCMDCKRMVDGCDKRAHRCRACALTAVKTSGDRS